MITFVFRISDLSKSEMWSGFFLFRSLKAMHCTGLLIITNKWKMLQKTQAIYDSKKGIAKNISK